MVLNLLAGDIYPTAVSLNFVLVSRNIVAVRLYSGAVFVNILAGDIYPTPVLFNAVAMFLSFLVVPGRVVAKYGCHRAGGLLQLAHGSAPAIGETHQVGQPAAR